MAVSEVSICNQALSWLGGNSIVSLDDGSNEANLCKANYAILRDAVLEAADWSFAIKRYRLTPLADEPEYQYAKAFALPAEVLRAILPLRYSDGQGYEIEDWVLEDRKILCDYSLVYFRGIYRVTDPARFSPLFTQALAARIAADLARPLTNSRTMARDMWDLFGTKLAEATSSDGMQGKNVVMATGKLINSRRRG